MKLSDLPKGQSAVIVKITGHGAFRKRMIEMGFTRGRVITAILQAPLRDPIKYSIMNYEVSLRRSEAEMVDVMPIEKEKAHHDFSKIDGNADPLLSKEFHGKRHAINVALVGNPNCGKTSLFNVASGAKEHVGNYSGVTVDSKTGHFDYAGYRINIVDLPGTYSLASYSPEELYVRRYLREESPDVIINVVAASNIERNMYLTTELIDMDRSMVIALNMFDELEKSGAKLDFKTLGEMIGVPIVPTVSRTGEGVSDLFDTVIRVFEEKEEAVRHVHVTYNSEIEESIRAIGKLLKAEGALERHFATRYLAIKLLEEDQEVTDTVRRLPGGESIIATRNREAEHLEATLKEDITSSIANEKYGFIAGALAETMQKGESGTPLSTSIIDAFVTNKLFGFPLFLGLMFAMFWVTFELGAYPMEWIEWIVDQLGTLAREYLPDGALKDLVADGIIGGVGGVIVFLPNIMILYLCISFMEDSGYMARAAFIMDKLMHRIGLHGKSFIPLVMGFGCNVPAIMSARAIESRSSRMITILINPFMSCSARLPVYVLLVGTFFPTHAATVILGLYLLGIVVAMITARLLRKFHFKRDETPFVMELPPYRVPTAKALWRHAWGKGEQYLRKMGGIILLASIIMWALNYFPLESGGRPSESRDSYLAMTGKAINPVMEPLGWHWKASVAAIAGVPAKEIVVSTLGVLYTGDEEADDKALSRRITAIDKASGNPDFTPAVALGFMVFILLYCPCLATITAIIKESGSWRYGAFSVLYNTAVAWVFAFLTYRVALLF